MSRQRLVPVVLALALATVALVYRDALVAWFSGRPVGVTTGTSVNAHAGKLDVTAALDPDPPTTTGSLVLAIADDAKRPVEGAHVTAEYDMPAMGAMAEMKGAARVEPEGGGRYRVRLDLPMPGTWTLRVSVDGPAGAGAFEYRFATGQPGLTTTSTSGGSGGDSAYYTCAMHTSVRAEAPGTCPHCAMPLTPVTKEEVATGTVQIAQDRRDLFGIRTAPVTMAPLRVAIRSVGRVTYDERRLSDVTLRLKGWISHLDVNATGQQVRRGQRLLTLYSPDLYAAQQEYLLALSAGAGAESLAAAAQKKLELWGVTPAQIADIAKRGQPMQDVPMFAPSSGTVIEKDVVEGAAVEAGQRLFRIAALDEVWVEAEVFEGDLPQVRAGQPATITLSYLPGRELAGKVAFVYPYLDPSTRTGRVRIALPNKDLALKPDMYANVALDVDLGARLQVPIAAVVYTGPRRLVFVDRGGGKLEPIEVTLGARSDAMVEVVKGLTAGQQVVVAGNFLVAAESRIRAAAFWVEGDHAAR